MVQDFKRFITRFRVKQNIWIFVPVSKTIDQHKRRFLFFSLLSNGFLLSIMLLGHLILNLNSLGTNMFSVFSSKTASYNNIFLKVMSPLVIINLISNVAWYLLHTKYSSIRNYRLTGLLRHATSELELLKHHLSSQEEETVKAVEWQFMYDTTNQCLYIKLLYGGHISQDRAEDVERRLTSFLKMRTSSKEWILTDTFIDDETATMNVTYGKSRTRYIIESIDDIYSDAESGLIKLDSELFFNPRKQVHLIAVGRTGSGKTSFLKNLILQIVGDARNRIYICDGKASYLSTLKDSIRGSTVATTGEELLEMLKEINSIIEERYRDNNEQSLNEEDVTYLDLHPEKGHIYFVFDEILALFSLVEGEDKLRKPSERILPKIQMYFTSILQLGRAANVHVILTGQQIPAIILPTSSREAFGARFILGKVDPSNAVEILGVGKNALPNVNTSNYSALVWLDGYGWDNAKTMLLPYMDESKLPFKATLRELTNYEL